MKNKILKQARECDYLVEISLREYDIYALEILDSNLAYKLSTMKADIPKPMEKPVILEDDEPEKITPGDGFWQIKCYKENFYPRSILQETLKTVVKHQWDWHYGERHTYLENLRDKLKTRLRRNSYKNKIKRW